MSGVDGVTDLAGCVRMNERTLSRGNYRHARHTACRRRYLRSARQAGTSKSPPWLSSVESLKHIAIAAEVVTGLLIDWRSWGAGQTDAAVYEELRGIARPISAWITHAGGARRSWTARYRGGHGTTANGPAYLVRGWDGADQFRQRCRRQRGRSAGKTASGASSRGRQYGSRGHLDRYLLFFRHHQSDFGGDVFVQLDRNLELAQLLDRLVQLNFAPVEGEALRHQRVSHVFRGDRPE